MTRPPPIDAWILEAEADLIRDRHDDTTRMVDTWLAQHALPDTVEYSSDHVGPGRVPGSFDYLTLPGEASPAQVEELASHLSRAYALPVFIRRTQLIAIPTFSMRTLEATGEYTYADLQMGRRRRDTAERQDDPHGLN